jgi:hypothetical protein
VHRPIEGELQGAAVERPGFGISGVRRFAVKSWSGRVTDSAACLDDMVGGRISGDSLVWYSPCVSGPSVAVSRVDCCSRLPNRASPGRGAGGDAGDIWTVVATFWWLACFELN